MQKFNGITASSAVLQFLRLTKDSTQCYDKAWLLPNAFRELAELYSKKQDKDIQKELDSGALVEISQ